MDTRYLSLQTETSFFNSLSYLNILYIFVALVVGYVVYKKYLSGAIERYQAQIDQIARENDISRDRYPYQDVSQRSVVAQNIDYGNTYNEPNKLANDYKRIFPDDLLPQDQETTDWSRSNPPGKGSLELKNMITAGQHLGVNTQGSSMKNANYQIRSEPPNPIMPVSIFNNSSITPDIYRKQLEVGSA